MPMPSNILTAKPPVHRKRRRAVPTPPPPTALTLVAAAYDTGVSVTLTFDRAIDAAGLVGDQINVVDVPGGNALYAGTGGVTVLSPETIQVSLVPAGEVTSGGLVLNASADTGIVADDDGGTWAGAAQLALPFP